MGGNLNTKFLFILRLACYPAVQNSDILSSGTLQEVIPRISEGDLDVSRHRISEFLSAHTAYELLPESGKV